MPRSVLFRLEPDESGHIHPVYDTLYLYQGKHLFTAIGVGRIRRGDVHLTPVAQHTLDALMAYSQSDHRRLVTMEIATAPAVAPRLRRALEAANEKDAIFFIARDHTVYDVIFNALHVDIRQPGRAQ